MSTREELREYYDNGQLRESCFLQDGQIDGEVVSYNEAGHITQKAHCQAGQLHGETLVYDATGWISQQLQYKEGQLEGEALLYEDGILRAQLHYKDGQPDGAQMMYDDNGNLASRKLEGTVYKDPAIALEQVLRLVKDGEIVTRSGKIIQRQVDTICVHGDEPTSLKVAQYVRTGLEKAGIMVVPLTEMGIS